MIHILKHLDIRYPEYALVSLNGHKLIMTKIEKEDGMRIYQMTNTLENVTDDQMVEIFKERMILHIEDNDSGVSDEPLDLNVPDR